MKLNSGMTLSKIRGLPQYLSLILYAAIAFALWKVYKLFAPSDTQKAQDKSEAEALKKYTTPEAQESSIIDAVEQALNKAGLQVTDVHVKLAQTLNRMMDTVSVDAKKIVSTIGGMSLQTFQLTYVAYKMRELAQYRNSHPFDSDSWMNLFEAKKLYGDLKYHLTVVLDDDSLKKLSNYTKSV